MKEPCMCGAEDCPACYPENRRRVYRDEPEDNPEIDVQPDEDVYNHDAESYIRTREYMRNLQYD